MFCPKCNTVYTVKQTIINLENMPVDQLVEAKYCPVCGWHAMEDTIIVDEMNIYDKVEKYNNCIVEILTNTITGDTSIGWYRTDKTEEITDEEL